MKHHAAPNVLIYTTLRSNTVKYKVDTLERNLVLQFNFTNTVTREVLALEFVHSEHTKEGQKNGRGGKHTLLVSVSNQQGASLPPCSGQVNRETTSIFIVSLLCLRPTEHVGIQLLN
jgi:hypothetical protein